MTSTACQERNPASGADLTGAAAIQRALGAVSRRTRSSYKPVFDAGFREFFLTKAAYAGIEHLLEEKGSVLREAGLVYGKNPSGIVAALENAMYYGTALQEEVFDETEDEVKQFLDIPSVSPCARLHPSWGGERIPWSGRYNFRNGALQANRYEPTEFVHEFAHHIQRDIIRSSPQHVLRNGSMKEGHARGVQSWFAGRTQTTNRFLAQAHVMMIAGELRDVYRWIARETGFPDRKELYDDVVCYSDIGLIWSKCSDEKYAKAMASTVRVFEHRKQTFTALLDQVLGYSREPGIHAVGTSFFMLWEAAEGPSIYRRVIHETGGRA